MANIETSGKTRILLTKSAIPNKLPDTSGMTYGEVFVNYASGVGKSFLSTKKNDDTLAQFMEKSYNDGAYADKSDYEKFKSDVEDTYATVDALSALTDNVIKNEYVVAHVINTFNQSAGFDENGNSTLGMSLTDAIKELQENGGNSSEIQGEINEVKSDVEELSGATMSFSGSVVNKFAGYYTSAQTDTEIATAKDQAISSGKSYTDAKVNSATSVFNNEIEEVKSDFDNLSSSFSALSGTLVTEIATKVSAAFIYKGNKAKYSDLPTSGNKIGDVWNVEEKYDNIPAGTNYAWDGEKWDALAGTVDLSNYATSGDVSTLSGKIDEIKLNYATSADVNTIISALTEEIIDNELVTSTSINKINESAGFDENGNSTIGKSLTDAIVELQSSKSDTGHTHDYLPLSGGTVNGNITAPKFIGALQGNADSATIAGHPTLLMYPQTDNEINFGGTGTKQDIYFGYRSRDGRPVPKKYIFGANGTAEIAASKFIGALQGNADTATNADMLDNCHASDFVKNYGNNLPVDANNVVGYGQQHDGWNYYGPAITFGLDDYRLQLQSRYDNPSIYVRTYYKDGGGFSDWKTIAFTDSNVASATTASTAGTATKLATPRTIWGQSFDGTQDVQGNLTNVNRIRFSEAGAQIFVRGSAYSSGMNDNDIGIFATMTTFSGKVAIGDTTADEKLHVHGNVKANSFIGNLTGISTGSYLLEAKPTPTGGGHCVCYYSGQPNLGDNTGNAKEGSNDYNLWSYPANSTSVANGTANIMSLRLQWSSSYLHEIFASPNMRFLWHRDICAGENGKWSRIVEENSTEKWAINISGNADNATKATQDGSGNVITSTYATKTELNNGLAAKSNTGHTHTEYLPSSKAITHDTGTTRYLMGVSTTATTTLGSASIYTSSKVYSNGSNIYATSDETLKDFIGDIDCDIEALSKLPKKYFTWKGDESKTVEIGTSAQKVKELYPEMVTVDPNEKLGVAYDKLSVVALAAIDKLYAMYKESQEEIKELKSRIEELEK